MIKDELIRLNILGFLAWNDSNGCYLDKDVRANEQEIFTIQESKLMFWDVLFRDKIIEFIDYDNALELNYIQINKFLIEQSLISVSDFFIKKLIENINKKDIYEEIIDSI